MLCRNPYYLGKGRNPNKIDLSKHYARLAITPQPCGDCMPCRINRSRELTHRIILEGSQHEDNCFITLTYDEENVPEGDNLNPRHPTLFMKRLRRAIAPKKIRYFLNGEYGGPPDDPRSRGYRPHYHFVLFGLSKHYEDIIKHSWRNKKGDYRCDFNALDRNGKRWLGDLTTDSARYISGYVTKKLTRPKDMRSPYIKEKHPALFGRTPEFATWSKGRNGGLGLNGIKKICDEYLSQSYGEKQILKSLNHGGHQYPLGRYLTRKLALQMDITSQELEKNLQEYQAELFDKAMQPDSNYYENIIKEKEKRTKELIWKHKHIYNSRTI